MTGPSFNQIALGILSLSFAAIASVQIGLIQPSHAVSINVAMDEIVYKIDLQTVKLQHAIGTQTAQLKAHNMLWCGDFLE